MQGLRCRVIVCWLALASPLLAAGLWLATLGVGYGAGLLIEGWIAALAFTGFLTGLARWRVLGPMCWLVAWLVYLAGFGVALLEAFAWYFQGSGFSIRFFANLRLTNLQSGLYAFPGMAVATIVVVLGVLPVSAWLLYRIAQRSRSAHGRALRGAATLVALALAAVLVPSAWQRLGAFAVHYYRGGISVGTLSAADMRLLADPNPVPRDAVRAAVGKNLVIIYMESLERIYTDDKIFPGLTPNLNRWRAQGLDYAGFLTYTGANYTIAGLFSSQCGAPYLPSPVRALELGGNNANTTSFQPNLACLGDVLHAAGYQQVFMNRVDLSFADDGTFFRLHGFNQVLGLQQLDDLNGKPLPHPGWGLYDSDLFRLATSRFEHLAATGKPFNLDVLTIDNHPPHGRPSPGCPKYTANANGILQAVHCTDDLVGKFLDTISKNPVFKNTVVVVMSDHQSMRNDAWPLYPAAYKRRPLLFILNAGQGRRDMRFYHMDISPTVLRLMGVETNATFLAGADRSAANAPGSPLVNTPADVAVLRKALWSRAQPLELCKGGVLIGAADDGVRIGDYRVPMLWRGQQVAGLWPQGAWAVAVNPHAVNGAVLTSASGNPLDEGGVAARLAHRAPDESVLLVHPLDGADVRQQFTVDWIGQRGGRTHLVDAPRLRGLEVRSPNCAALLQRMNALPAGKTLDLSGKFKAVTAPLYPKLGKSRSIVFNGKGVLPFEREVGWTRPEGWGSFSVGDYARLGFTLPKDHCHSMDFDFKVHPYLPASRPRLDVGVYANAALLTTWHFGKHETATTWRDVSALVRTPDPQCRVDLKFVFTRPGAAPQPYPNGEDWRRLQLLFLNMRPAADDLEAAEVTP